LREIIYVPKFYQLNMSQEDMRRGTNAEKWDRVIWGGEKIPDRRGGADTRYVDSMGNVREREVKLGNARLTEVQERRRDELGDLYEITRYRNHEIFDISPSEIQHSMVGRRRFRGN
jgi:hypothetical protein